MADKLTVDQAARMLGYHPNHVRRLLRQGRMDGERFNRVWMIDPQEVRRLQELQTDTGRLPSQTER